MKKVRILLLFTALFFQFQLVPFEDIQAVIFDCDGVLVDSEQLKHYAWQKAVAAYNVDFSLEDYLPLVGESAVNILAKISGLKNVILPACLIDSRNSEYAYLQNQQVIPMQPMVHFVSDLWRNRVVYGIKKLAAASSACQKEIMINLERIGLTNVFDVIVSGEDDLDSYGDKKDTNKPAPYIYLEASKKLAIAPEHCLVFEDSAAGVTAAAAAGMRVIAVPNQCTLGHDFSRATKVMLSLSGLSWPIKEIN